MLTQAHKQRIQQLEKIVEESYNLLFEIEERLLLEVSPIERQKLLRDLQNIREPLEKWESELKALDDALYRNIDNEPKIQPTTNPLESLSDVDANILRLQEQVINPYVGYSGHPVVPPNFVGRDDIIQQIHKLWQGPGQLKPLILYGHRMMGKSSILRNLNPTNDAKILLVLLDMQVIAMVNNTGQFLYQIARAIYKQAQQAKLDCGSNLDKRDFATTGEANLQLRELLEKLDQQMEGRRLILAVDEFEVIQKRIEQGRIEGEVLEYLRGLNEEYKWLGLIFAGLHELEEMGRDYQNAFYGRAKNLKVSYLHPDAARQLVIQPWNHDFKLDYDEELVVALYYLTYGQPYLIQLLCWELVEQWNRQVIYKPEGLPATLTLLDLDTALTERFFDEADNYFHGAWSQIGYKEPAKQKTLTTEQQILRSIADWQERNRGIADTIVPVEKEKLREITELPDEELEIAFKDLERRDLLEDRGNRVSFFSEIMRRWVVHEMKREAARAAEEKETKGII